MHIHCFSSTFSFQYFIITIYVPNYYFLNNFIRVISTSILIDFTELKNNYVKLPLNTYSKLAVAYLPYSFDFG